MAKISNFWIPEIMLGDIFRLFSLLADKNLAKSNWKVKFTKFTDIYTGNALKKIWGSVFLISNIIQLFVGEWFFLNNPVKSKMGETVNLVQLFEKKL